MVHPYSLNWDLLKLSIMKYNFLHDYYFLKSLMLSTLGV